MQRETLYNLHRKTYFNCVLFLFKKSKILWDQFLRLQKLISQNFAFFENKKINFVMWIVERFTLHLEVYFVFSYEMILGDKKMK
jgi:hypothetical protein